MIKKIDQTEWDTIFNVNQLGQFFSPDFINLVSASFNVDTHYYVSIRKNKLLLAYIAFESNKNIIVPSNLWYQPFFINSDVSDVQKNELLQNLIGLLKQRFNKISLRLAPQIEDIRPFIWNSFKIDVRYTYVKTQPSKSHYSVYKNLDKLNLNQFEFKIDSVTKQAVDLNFETLSQIHISKNNQSRFSKFLKLLSEKNICKSTNLYQNGNLVASCIIMIDDIKKQIFTLFLNSNKNADKYVHTLLYESVINYTFENDYNGIDLCGANMQKIADFKSYFNCELKAYYVVTYNPAKAKFNSIFNKGKKLIRKMRNNLS